MKTVKEESPRRHERHLVMRNGFLFTATPCYGMHSPWWVVRTMSDKNCGEVDPINMLDTDQHMTLNDAVELYHKDSSTSEANERIKTEQTSVNELSLHSQGLTDRIKVLEDELKEIKNLQSLYDTDCNCFRIAR
jgi:hypothetical protein